MKANQIHDDEQALEPFGQERNSPFSTNGNPISVAAEDYTYGWNTQGPFAQRGDKIDASTKSSVNFTLAHLSLQDSTRHNPHKNGKVPSVASKKAKQEDELVAMMQNPQRLHSSLREKEKKRERRAEKHAAKAAATYYGECYLEGVGMSHADKAARESHAGYKKWWLQEDSQEFNASLGDAFNVPIFNPPSKPNSKMSLEGSSTGLDKKVSASSRNVVFDDSEYQTAAVNLKEIGGTANLAATATLKLFESSSDHAVHAGRRMLDRSSGARNPPPTESKMADLAAEERRKTKKRQRSFTKRSSRDDVADNIPHSKPISILNHTYSVSQKHGTSNPGYISVNDNIHGIDPNATTDEEVHHQISRPPHSLHVTQKDQTKRVEFPRRMSSSSDHNSGSRGAYHSQLSSYYCGVHEEKEAKDENRSVFRHEGHKYNEENPYRDGDHEKFKAILTSVASPMKRTAKHIVNAKLELIRALAVSEGDVTNSNFLFALEQLRTLYTMTGNDARLAHISSKKKLEGNWLTISRPHFPECIGTNSSGEFMYTLGRLSFDMFAPGNLICSIGGIFNRIEMVNPQEDKSVLRSVPKSLKEEVEKGESILRRYDIITAFKIEPASPLFGYNSPNKDVPKILRGTITTYGYVLPDPKPKKTNRLSIWFSGGKIEPNVEDNEKELWIKAFGGGVLKRHLQEKARILAARLLLGAKVPSKMEEDGSMEFELTRPIGAHGSTYVDTLYLDENLRIAQGHKGSLFVFTRVTT